MSAEVITYVIACGPIANPTHVKIGITSCIEKRLSQLQTGNPWPLRVMKTFRGNREHEFHRAFQNYRCSGEWFEFTGLVKAFLNSRKLNPDSVEDVPNSLPISDPVDAVVSHLLEKRLDAMRVFNELFRLDWDIIKIEARRAWDEFGSGELSGELAA